MRCHEWPLGGSAGPRKGLGAQADIQERFGAFEGTWSAQRQKTRVKPIRGQTSEIPHVPK